MSLRSRAIVALKWSAGSLFLAKLITWAITLYVIRILSPADYGLMALAVVLTNFVGLFNDLGLNAALIQKRELGEPIVAKIFGAILCSSALLFFILQISAGPFANFYANDTLEDVIRVLSLQLLIGAFASVPSALLLRDISFRGMSIVELARSVGASLIVLALALNGWGVWALVVGSIAGAVFYAGGILAVTKFALRPSFDFTGLAAELRFGARMVAKGIVSFFNRQIDVVLVGRLLGVESLGAYSIAADLAKMPTRLLLRPISRVSFPTTARMQDEPERVRSMYLSMASAASLVFFPLLWGGSVLADDLVHFVLGMKWAASIPVIQIICLVIPLRLLSRLAQPMLDGMGRPDIGLRNLITTGVCLPPAIVLGVTWGLTGVASGWVLGHLVSTAVNLRRSLPVLRIDGRALATAVVPPALCAAAMCGLVLATSSAVVVELSQLARLIVLIGVGAGSYGALILLFNRNAAFNALSLLRH